MKRKALVRLLGPGCYDTGSINSVRYPVIVEAELCSIMTEHAEVSAKVLDQFAPLCTPRMYGLTWFNPLESCGEVIGDGEVSWELYEPPPFEAWNNLKRSREVGQMPHTETIYR